MGAAGALSNALIPFAPTLDAGSEDAVIPKLPSRVYARRTHAKIPFLTGTNGDKGTLFSSFTSNYTTTEIREDLINSLRPSELAQDELESIIDQVLELYPDESALGSPYGTGNETFGSSSRFKRFSSIGAFRLGSIISCGTPVLTGLPEGGDKNFQSGRKQLNRLSSDCDDGVKSWEYVFTDPQSVPFLRVRSNLTLGLGSPANRTGALELSKVMVDYWISFAVGLDPNDGKGSKRPVWEEYSVNCPTVLQLENGNTSNVADDYGEGAMDLFLDNPVAFRH
ncbi:Alpha/Beta hydrolase protein [Pterulicium gracile]|uniref:Alpha/Beta hydrolase protein n=1 Tax=Pterulicium gracile TaxID=1884261 RepID=A0A5C3QAD2_9AGAR|nr:Alpha/Beta hydrolase protein [Pterula gracilis]